MSYAEDLERTFYSEMYNRYIAMASGTDSAERIFKMLDAIMENLFVWPKDKTGRWVGYVQAILIEVEHKTTTKEERDWSRPYFHMIYKAQGYPVPKTIEI